MVGVGGFFIMGGGLLPQTSPQVLGALSVLLAFVNVSGGFVITKRMLDMFKRISCPRLPLFTSLTFLVDRPDGSSRVPVAVYYSRCPFRCGICRGREHRYGRACTGWLSRQ
jgi:4TM region of pyridine nucleotide transhydrogenase, mitoch